MSETKTAEQTDEDFRIEDMMPDPDEAAAKSLAQIRPEQQRWDDYQKAMLRQLGVEDATEGDLDIFFHMCRVTGLDPFRKQIYMIGRNTKVTEWVDNANGTGRRKQERFVTKYTIQIGIDGYRRMAREAAKLLGDELRLDGPWFTGADDFHVTDDGEVIQHWRKVWPAGSVPHAARFVVYRNGEPYEGIAHYDEFVQTNPIYQGEGQGRRKVGDEPNSMWAKMPRNQIGKCAEGLAYRRAYPDEMSGMILDDAANVMVIDEDGNVDHERSGPAAKRRPTGRGAAGVRAARERRQHETRQRQQREQPPVVVVEGEVEPEQATEPEQAEPEQASPDSTSDDDAGAHPDVTPSEDVEALRKAARGA